MILRCHSPPHIKIENYSCYSNYQASYKKPHRNFRKIFKINIFFIVLFIYMEYKKFKNKSNK